MHLLLVHMYYLGVEVYLLGVNSLLLLCRSQELNSSYQAWWQTPLTFELTYPLKKRLLKCSCNSSFTTFINSALMGTIYLNLEIIQRQML